MTDFIESQNIDDSYSIYNEEYSWAEEYSEYYSEDSSNYLMPVFESSSYQFFGVATFYQEASHKGLIAGGILALVSGALFMIMKLLNGGGGGSSSSSSSSSDMAKEMAEAKRKDEEDRIYWLKKEQEEERRQKLKEAERKKKAVELEYRKKVRAEEERFAEEQKEIKKRAEAREEAREQENEARKRRSLDYEIYINSEEYTSFGKDEAEIIFNPADIINDLKKVKSENPGKFKLKGGWKRLNNMQETLKDIERIVDTLNAMITDNNWEVFSHSSIENTDKMEDGDTKTFIISYRNLKDNFTKLRELINGKQDNVEELEIDDIIAFFNSIKQITDEINKKCKSGIAKCKKRHEYHVDRKANLIRENGKNSKEVDNESRNIANVKSAYNILNNILKEVNEFCKGLRDVFRGVCYPGNYTNHTRLPFNEKVYSDLRLCSFKMLADMEVADIEDVIKGLTNLQRKKAGIDREQLIKDLKSFMQPYEIDPAHELSHSTPSTGFSELAREVDSLRKNSLDDIREQKRIAEKIKNDYPEISEYFLKILSVYEDFYNVPVEEWAKVKSVYDRQEGLKLRDIYYDLEGPYQYNVAKKTVERYFKKYNQIHMNDINSST